MDVEEAKETMRLYIEGQLQMYKDILGKEENFDSNTLSGLTVQKLEDAFTVIEPLLL